MSGFAPPPKVKLECDTCNSTWDVLVRRDGIQKCAYCRRAEFVIDAANNHMRTMELTTV